MKRIIFLLFLFLSPALAVRSQESLPVADNLANGVLPNGISYYLLHNNDSKGYADYSLIQRGMAGNRAISDILSETENFKTRPYRFLSSKGIAYGEDGYVSSFGNDAVIRFRDVPVYDSAAADSSLMLVFELMKDSPAEQALVICGDIDAQKMLQQIKLLSLSIPERSSITETSPYTWEASYSPAIICEENNASNLASIEFSYTRPRTPEEFMTGTRPYVSKVLSGMLGNILTWRIESSFRAAGIPLSGIRTIDIGSAQTPYDEQFIISLNTSAEKLYDAVAALSGSLASIDIGGATLEELKLAKGASSWELSHDAAKGSIVSNREYTDLCIASYLYGAPVLAKNAVRNYFSGRYMDPELELSVFNKFASAVLSPSDNLTVRICAPKGGADSEIIARTLSGNWHPIPEAASSAYSELNSPTRLKKTKIKTSLTDPVTSGTVWTFANGFKLTYKNIPDNEGISYALVLRGGATSIPNLKQGEYAFANDLVSLFKVAGMSADSFRKSLLSKSVSFNPEIGISDFTIRGEAPSGQLETLMCALALYANRRQVDAQAFDYYKLCKSIEAESRRISEDGVRDRMEDMAVRNNLYSSFLDTDKLDVSLMSKLDKYLDLLFSKTDDGSLVIIGDLDQTELLNTVSKYAGLFGTGRKVPAAAGEQFYLIPGWNTRTYDAATSGMGPETKGVNILLSTYYPFSVKNSIASEIACEAIKLELNRALAEYGMYAVLDRENYLSPSEMISVFISCKPCNPEGLPSAVRPQNMDKALASVRKVIAALSLTRISEGLLEASKNNIGHRYASQANSPSFLMEAAIIRNSLGMNIVSGYKPILDSVKESDVSEVLKYLDNALKVEFIYK